MKHIEKKYKLVWEEEHRKEEVSEKVEVES